jgi:hypothetical protein
MEEVWVLELGGRGAVRFFLTPVEQRAKRRRDDDDAGGEEVARKDERLDEGAGAEERAFSAVVRGRESGDDRAFDLCMALPPDMQWELCRFLGPRELLASCLVSKSWFAVFASDRQWSARYCTEFKNHGEPLPALRLQEDWNVSAMSMYAFRTKLEFLADGDLPVAVARRRWGSCGFALEHMNRLSQLIEAEGPVESSCCAALRFMTVIAPVITEQLVWPQRSAALLASAPPQVKPWIQSVRYLRFELQECQDLDEGTHYKLGVSFLCDLAGGRFIVHFHEGEPDDDFDFDFPYFVFVHVETDHRMRCTLFPEDLWKDDPEDLHGHPLRQFEDFRCLAGICKGHMLTLIEMLLLVVRRSSCIGPLEELRYQDVECSDCGHVHLN